MTINSNSDVELESSPVDDEVFESAPKELMLRFSTYVKLVKLTMKNPEEKFVNIGFRYDPAASRVFFLDLPEIPPALYYTIEWTAIDPSNLVARGSFSFSFGPDASSPFHPDPGRRGTRPRHRSGLSPNRSVFLSQPPRWGGFASRIPPQINRFFERFLDFLFPTHSTHTYSIP